MNLFNIIKGWYRFLFKKRSEMAIDRLKVCKSCDLRKGRFCSVCWCELDAKAEVREEDCEHPNGSKWESSDKYYSLSGSRKHPLSNQKITCFTDDCDFKTYNDRYNFIDGGYVPPK